MFRNIVSNLPFSPALVGQLGFYAKRLRKEEATRRIGLVFTALALVVQSFAVFSPPQAANASSNADFVRGGVSSVAEFMKHYDSRSENIKDLFDSLGITRGELSDAKSTTIGEAGYYNWSMTSLYSYAQGQRAYTFFNSAGATDTVYNRPMSLTQEGQAPYPVFAGFSQKFGWFAIKKDCGNLITKKRPPEDKPPVSSCDKLTATLINRTQVRLKAKADVKNGAKIKSYTFTIKNSNDKVIDVKQVASTAETTEYVYDRTKPGTYHASVVVDTSLGQKSDPNCKASFTIEAPITPFAECRSLTSQIVGRTHVELTGAATASGGATISKYTFVIKDASGKVISRQVVTSHALSAAADAVVIATPGAYTATLTVTTSLGNKTDAKDCVEQFTIVPPKVCPVNPSLPANSPDCQPCPGNPSIWIKDAACESDLILSKTATNMTNGDVDATTVVAQASDKIAYTVNVENKGLLPTTASLEEKLEDVLQYSSLIDAGGGVFNTATATLTWPTIELKAGEKQSRTFVVQLQNEIAATNTGTSDGASYDCVMTNTFGNSIDISVNCPVQKVIVEQVVKELPQTGPRENLIFAGVLLSVVVYFYTRARQTNKEVRLIRRDLNAGTI